MGINFTHNGKKKTVRYKLCGYRKRGINIGKSSIEPSDIEYS